MPSRSATARACSGPAPPKAIRAKSRGSSPRSTAISRMALAMFSSAVRTQASAACLGRQPERVAEPRRRPRARRRRRAASRRRGSSRGRAGRAPGWRRSRSARCRRGRRRPGPARRRRSAARHAAGRPCRSRRSSRRRRRSSARRRRGWSPGCPRRCWNSVAYCWLPLEDEADVAARAAHVEGEGRRHGRPLGEVAAADDAAGEAGEQQLGRALPRLLGAEIAAVRGEQVPVRRRPVLSSSTLPTRST